MPLPSPIDVGNAFRTRWGSDSGLSSLIPSARVYGELVGAQVTWPYAKLITNLKETISEGGIRWRAIYEVIVEGYSIADPIVTPSEANLIAANVGRVFGGDAGNPTSGIVVANAIQTISCLQQGGSKIRPTGERREGQQALLISTRFRLVLNTAKP